ncbi:MAG: type II toxin-antitoxin system VapC family toxin [Nitrospiraceae bacterium]|nr:type II toxin-antitoxin system VapC family toxin [Nitrospiraceae bacterium]
MSETSLGGCILTPQWPARQRVTRNWMVDRPTRYELFVSQVTVDECAAGDADAASERLDVIRDVPLLDQTDAVENLAHLLISRLAVPGSQPRDALHIAIAAVHGVEFIVTWNFKHILNPHLQTRIADTCYEGGYVPPVICTPEQLMESEDESS